MRMGIFRSFAHDDVRRIKSDLRDDGGICDHARGQTGTVENYQMRLVSPVAR
jgi:hypothetical protein